MSSRPLPSIPNRASAASYFVLPSGSHERTAISVTLDTVKELKDKSPNFVGMKHAVNDLDFVTECLAAVGRDFRIFVGLEDLSFPMMTVGACGLMNAVGNLQPRLLAEINAFLSDDACIA